MTTKLEHKMSEVTVEKELLKEKIKNLENALNVLLQEKVRLESKINKYYRLNPPGHTSYSRPTVYMRYYP